MHTVTYRKLLFLSILVLVVSPLFFQGSATPIQTPHLKTAKISSTAVTGSILTIERRINNTEVEINQSVIVELILTNQGNNPVYNIKLDEQIIKNPEIITKNLFNPMNFTKIEAHEQRIISYTITSLKAGYFTFDKAVVTYQQTNTANAPLYTSYSTYNSITITANTVSQNTLNLSNLLVVSVIAILYSIILAIRIFFNIFKRSKS